MTTQYETVVEALERLFVREPWVHTSEEVAIEAGCSRSTADRNLFKALAVGDVQRNYPVVKSDRLGWSLTKRHLCAIVLDLQAQVNSLRCSE